MHMFHLITSRATALPLLFFLFALCPQSHSGMDTGLIPHHSYIVQLEDGHNLKSIQTEWRMDPVLRDISADWKELSARIRAYRLRLKTSEYTVTFIEDRIKELGGVKHVKTEEQLDYRTTIPDDSLYHFQYHLPLIEAETAWDFSTGGVTALGDTIVLAILDSGFDLEHEDLRGSIWKNRDEIPDNQVDDDGNGYVDDYLGLHVQSGNDNHPVSFHGTAVSGLCGAGGNNVTGITGVNWNVQLMFLSVGTDAEVIEAYEYIIAQREEYEATEGNKGAYVVATNLSAGLDTLFPEDQPMWCAMYEQLLLSGILNACAAPNTGINIDTEGDIPGTCPSAGTIIVTNTDRNDIKLSTAGYGPVNVDMSAPGKDVFSLTSNNGYDDHTGTSFSSPLVAGAIALLHSAPCEAFAQYAKDQPEAAALLLKDIILRSIDPVPSLEGISVAEGRLNIKNAMVELAEDRCGAKTGPVQILNLYPNPAGAALDQLEFEYQVPDYQNLEWKVYDMGGREVLSGTIHPPAFDAKKKILDISMLSAGMYYLDFRHPEARTGRKFVVQ